MRISNSPKIIPLLQESQRLQQKLLDVLAAIFIPGKSSTQNLRSWNGHDAVARTHCPHCRTES